MEKKMEIKDLKAEQERLRGIFRNMLNRKREEQRTAEERFENDPLLKEAFEQLSKENAERGTPFIRIQL